MMFVSLKSNKKGVTGRAVSTNPSAGHNYRERFLYLVYKITIYNYEQAIVVVIVW
jgi:hypothetical protein